MIHLVGYERNSEITLFDMAMNSRKSGKKKVHFQEEEKLFKQGAFLGLYGNLRYQILYGLERALHDHFYVFRIVIFTSSTLRMVNIQIGDVTRLRWLGLRVNPMLKSNIRVRGYNRPLHDTHKSKWLLLMDMECQPMLIL